MNKKISANLVKTIFSVVLIVIVLISLAGGVFNSPPEKAGKLTPPITVPDNEFMVGVMDCAWDNNYANLPDLHLNAWHKYTTAVPTTCTTANGWLERDWLNYIPEDRYERDIDDYLVKIRNRVDTNRRRGMRSIMDRPKTGYLAFGQRSYYQCEQQVHLKPEYADYWFYTYENSIHNQGLFIEDVADYEFGHGEMVKQCLTIPTSPGSNAAMIVSVLRANHEQANDQYGFMKGDKECNWYVMPRIRIPVGTADNTPVCSLEVRNWNNTVIKQQVIYAVNFKDQNYYYNGKYLQEFYWEHPSNDPPSGIEILAGQICPTNPDKHFNQWPGNIDTDFRVHWYGYCDMWIDYVLVENEPAHKLFITEKQYWENQIRLEVHDLALHGSPYPGYVPNIFYQEEMEFNCIPCIGYVNQIIQDEALKEGVELSLMPDINYELFKIHVPDFSQSYDMTAAQLKKYIVDSGHVKTIVVGNYPLWGYETGNISHHPTSLATWDYNRDLGHLSHPASPSVYDDLLQTQLDQVVPYYDRFCKILKLFDAVTKTSPADVRLIRPSSFQNKYCIFLTSIGI